MRGLLIVFAIYFFKYAIEAYAKVKRNSDIDENIEYEVKHNFDLLDEDDFSEEEYFIDDEMPYEYSEIDDDNEEVVENDYPIYESSDNQWDIVEDEVSETFEVTEVITTKTIHKVHPIFNKNNLKNAVILQELLNKPKSIRKIK